MNTTPIKLSKTWYIYLSKDGEAYTGSSPRLASHIKRYVLKTQPDVFDLEKLCEDKRIWQHPKFPKAILVGLEFIRSQEEF